MNMSITFKDLRIFQIAENLNHEIEKIIETLPPSERFRLKDQILRSSRSISANIAEGYAKKAYQADLVKHLRYALGSSDETQSHIQLITKSKLIEDEKLTGLMRQYKNLSVRIVNFINTIQKTNHSQAIR
jgi:four helix bundle protein